MTIKDLAESIGVSKTTINNTIKELGLKPALKEGHKQMLDLNEAEVKAIKDRLLIPQTGELWTEKTENQTENQTKKTENQTEKTENEPEQGTDMHKQGKVILKSVFTQKESAVALLQQHS